MKILSVVARRYTVLRVLVTQAMCVLEPLVMAWIWRSTIGTTITHLAETSSLYQSSGMDLEKGAMGFGSEYFLSGTNKHSNRR